MHPILPSLTLIVTAVLAAGGLRHAAAQSITVQQPVIEQFGVTTVVSVPDRGSMLLGSVGSSGAIHRRGGPFGPQVNRSRQQRHGSLRAHVWIHDFEAMDAALLAEGRGTPTGRLSRGRSHSPLNGMAAIACDQLLKQHELSSTRMGVRPEWTGLTNGTARSDAAPRAHERAIRFAAGPATRSVGVDSFSQKPSHHAAAGSTARRFGSRTFK